METVGLTFIDPFAWAVGIFEGEGCLTFKNPRGKNKKGHWTMIVEMTDMDVLWSFYESIGCVGNMSGLRKKAPSRKENHKPTGTWSTSKRQLIHDLIIRMYPYLHDRRRAKCDEFFAWYHSTK